MTNFSVPFSLTPTGQVSTTIDPNQIASDRMESLVGTYPGERVMLPDYGVNIPPLLFASDIEQQEPIIALEIQQETAKWEPTLVLSKVSIGQVETEPGVTRIDVQYSLSNNSQLTPPSTAVILLGGTVIG